MQATQAINIEKVIENIGKYIVSPIFYGLAIIMLIYAGILFLTSAGDPSKITRAKIAVLWATVGIFIGIIAQISVGLIKFIVGI